MSFKLPELPYAYDALSPFMSRETLEYHHDKHHSAYVETANKLAKAAGLGDVPLEEVIGIAQRKPSEAALYNNAAQHWNHCEFWLSMKPKGGGAIPSEVEKQITDSFGSVEKFKEEFVAQGVSQFGSGWIWLVPGKNKLEILKTGNADNPLKFGKTPLLTCDVWEHAYYIDCRNRRADFLRAFIENLVNWDHVAERQSLAARRTAA